MTREQNDTFVREHLSAARFCKRILRPPIAPPLTSEDLAREFRVEFKEDFESYFSDAQTYLRCLDDERQEVMEELNATIIRYDRFLNDSKIWGK